MSDGLTLPSPKEAGAEAPPTVVLVKVYTGVRSLSLASGDTFLEKDQVVKVLVEAAGKGPRAKVCQLIDNEEDKEKDKNKEG